MTDVDEILHAAAIATRTSWRHTIPPADKYAIARPEVAITALEAPGATRKDLVRAGWAGIEREHQQQIHGLGPRAVRYWTHGPDDACEAVDERLTIRAVMAALPDHHRRALTLIATHITVDAAAAVAGVPTWRMRRDLRAARARALRLWHDTERPPLPTVVRRDHRTVRAAA